MKCARLIHAGGLIPATGSMHLARLNRRVRSEHARTRRWRDLVLSCLLVQAPGEAAPAEKRKKPRRKNGVRDELCASWWCVEVTRVRCLLSLLCLLCSACCALLAVLCVAWRCDLLCLLCSALLAVLACLLVLPACCAGAQGATHSTLARVVAASMTYFSEAFHMMPS